MIPRLYADLITRRLADRNKVVIIYGPRQVGKTTLARQVLARLNPGRMLEINADDTDFTPILSSRSLQKLSGLVAGYDLLFIDEAQRVPDIGINLKILHDHFPNLQIITTGSSSFDLANQVQEPLTGRTWTFNLFPIGLCELTEQYNRAELDLRLEAFLRYGAYPEILSIGNYGAKEEGLKGIARSYLFKDVLEIGGVRYATKLRDLVKLLAYQIGSEVSLNELSNKLGISRETVASYIDLLEKTFVVFRLGGYSRNLRKEVVQHPKIYFHDLGIRNALIENFSPLQARNDVGQLWENFLVVERIKTQLYAAESANRYFWRTYTGAELDYVEERNGQLNGFEFKFGNRVARAPKRWMESYSEASFQLVNQENYLDFLLPGKK
jgi:hypothetical protein